MLGSPYISVYSLICANLFQTEKAGRFAMPAVWGIQRKTGVLRGRCFLLLRRFAQTAFFAVWKQGVAGRQLSIDRIWNGVTTDSRIARLDSRIVVY